MYPVKDSSSIVLPSNMITKNALQVISDKAITIVETWRSGNNWYRIWSDGWCEQGGISNVSISSNSNVKVNLIKAYPNTNYTLVVARTNTFGANSGTYLTLLSGELYSKSNNSFVSYCYVKVSKIDWYACGML